MQSMNRVQRRAHCEGSFPFRFRVAALKSAERNTLGLALGQLAVRAGEIVMGIYRRSPSVAIKRDASPVTEADLAAETIIIEGLGMLLPGLPVVSEECPQSQIAPPGDAFVLVDPLDGTREFVSGRDEFTINIALIVEGRPVAGAVYAPSLDELWYAGSESFRLSVAPGVQIAADSPVVRVRVRQPLADSFVVLISRSHRDPATEDFLDRLSLKNRRPMGSSLKFCRIAQGDADLYVRLAPTHEWDTAAGDAILSAAGGLVLDPSGVPLRYGKAKSGFLHEGFVALGGFRPSWDWDDVRLSS